MKKRMPLFGSIFLALSVHVVSAYATDIVGEWSGAYEFSTAGKSVRYEDLLIILRADAGTIVGSAGPHEYEQYQIDKVRITGDTATFELYRGRAGTTYFSVSFSGDRANGMARIERQSGSQVAAVVLDRVPVAPVITEAEPVDLKVMEQIRQEALTRSKVMEHAYYLSDLYGPRLIGSRNFKAAGDWLTKWLSALGLENIKEEAIPNAYPGWESRRFTIQQLEPTFAPLIGAPLAWSAATPGRISGDAVIMIPTIADSRAPEQFFSRYRGKLRGKLVFIDAPQKLVLPTTPAAHRLTDDEIARLTKAPEPLPPPTRTNVQSVSLPDDTPVELSTAYLNRPEGFVAQVFEFLKGERVAALVQEGRRINEAGTVRAMGARPGLPPAFVLASEHYNRIVRLVEHGTPVRLELDLETQLYDSAPNSFNVVGEIPGTQKNDEVVMLGAHLDSWTAGTGATDNAAGCAIVMETLRILKQLNLKMDRTVRAAFWGAEETGPIGGSTAYVKAHFADLDAHVIKPDYDKLSVYFNLDSGTGKIRGVYLEGFEGLRPAVETWLQPFKDLGVNLIGRRISFGSDQAPFVRAGLPVIYPEQDPLDFETRTNHTNMDTYDRLQDDDLREAAAIMAALVYDAATNKERMPRKALLPFQIRH
jgi:carboxypeptidase Q